MLLKLIELLGFVAFPWIIFQTIKETKYFMSRKEYIQTTYADAPGIYQAGVFMLSLTMLVELSVFGMFLYGEFFVK